MKITPNALTVNQLFSSTNEQFVIPAYQRRYSWRERQIWELVEDIQLLEEADTHLLGSIVCLTGSHTAGLNKLELVDGQQRLTTLSIILECIRDRMLREKKSDQANDLARLLAAKAFGGSVLRKVSLDSLDADEFELLVKREGDVEDFQNQRLAYAFDAIREWIDEESVETLEHFTFRLQNQALIIRLDVNDAKDAFKLFETINNRGLRLSPTDIIKNFVLGNAARFGSTELSSARSSWAKLVTFLDGTDSDAFFRYFLISRLEKRITKSEVVPEFKKLFMNDVSEAADLPDRHLYADELDGNENEDDDDSLDDHDGAEDMEIALNGGASIAFKDFLVQLVQSAKAYGELVLVKTDNVGINRHLRNLRMIKAAQTYGFLMHLRVNGCSDLDFRKVLKLTESFVLRRHTCRARGNETETLFAKLCAVDAKSPVAAVKRVYRDASPSDEEFIDKFAKTQYTANIMERARYCLEQLERQKHGKFDELEVGGADAVHVEHIIPQKITTKRAKATFGDWMEYLGDGSEFRHPEFVARIGNLTLFAGPLNIGVSNNPFRKKKVAYKDSAILMTKDLAGRSVFNFNSVERRSKDLALEAVELWPRP